MSRVAKMPVTLPSGVQVTQAAGKLAIKGPKGTLSIDVHPAVEIKQDGSVLSFAGREGAEGGMRFAGTARALVANVVEGLTKGYQKQLELVGVGYRAQVQGKKLNLTLGFSHPVEFVAPEGITIETPEQTKIVIKGFDKQLVGQVAAKIRGYRPPEPYKGKGVRYSDERVVIKEAKKK